MNDDEKGYVSTLQANHAIKLEMARAPGEFIAGILSLAEDPEFTDMAEAYGEGADEIIGRVLAGQVVKYLNEQKAKPAEAPEPIAVNNSVKEFRAKMGAGK